MYEYNLHGQHGNMVVLTWGCSSSIFPAAEFDSYIMYLFIINQEEHAFVNHSFSLCLYTPVYRWYDDVRPSIRPSVRPGLRPSVTVFRTFLLHALTYWAEILHMTLF